jgi:hypothetical protein
LANSTSAITAFTRSLAWFFGGTRVVLTVKIPLYSLSWTRSSLYITLKLSIQRALPGEVTDRLIAVTCGLKERRIQIRAYVSGNVTEEDIERIQSVGGEVIADFPDGYTIDESSVSVNDGEPQMLDFWPFSRAKH